MNLITGRGRALRCWLVQQSRSNTSLSCIISLTFTITVRRLVLMLVLMFPDKVIPRSSCLR